MLKFRCQHCGQRIAVPPKHLGKLVTCAECGAQTHPLAKEFVDARPAAKQSTAPVKTRPEAPAPRGRAPTAAADTSVGGCANCGRPVGRLQASHEWEGERVCGGCYHVLSAESSLGAAKAAPVVATRVRALAPEPASVAPPAPAPVGLREQVVRGLVVFVVGVVALYGALTLLRDLAGLIAVTAVAVLSLLALYGVFRSRWVNRFRQTRGSEETALVPARR